MFLFVVVTASAHIEMDKPNPVTDELKTGPCGGGSHVRGEDIAEYEPGETIKVKWHETVDHESTYRISFDDDGDDSFADPETPDDYYTNDTVLLDEIPDEPGKADYAVDVTLPDIECESCTLQLIQLMLDKPPYVPGTNDIYYQCADLALRATAPPEDTDLPAEEEDGGSEENAACGCAAMTPQAFGLLLPFVGWIAARRKRVTVRADR